MIGVTCRRFAQPATTTKQHMMAAAVARGGGRSKSLALGELDRRGQSCVRTREIR